MIREDVHVAKVLRDNVVFLILLETRFYLAIIAKDNKEFDDEEEAIDVTLAELLFIIVCILLHQPSSCALQPLLCVSLFYLYL